MKVSSIQESLFLNWRFLGDESPSNGYIYKNIWKYMFWKDDNKNDWYTLIYEMLVSLFYFIFIFVFFSFYIGYLYKWEKKRLSVEHELIDECLSNFVFFLFCSHCICMSDVRSPFLFRWYNCIFHIHVWSLLSIRVTSKVKMILVVAISIFKRLLSFSSFLFPSLIPK